MKKLALLLFLASGLAVAQTAPVTIQPTAPTVDAACSTSAGYPSVVVERATNRAYCCTGSPTTWQPCDMPVCDPNPPTGACSGTPVCVGTSGWLWGCDSGSWGQISGVAAFSAIGSGTNTAAAMLVGTGASLGTSGSGTIAATTAENAEIADVCDALAADPDPCAASSFVTDVSAAGVLNCATPVLGTDTTGSYAAGDAEAGNATGLACTDCVALGTETTGSYAGSDTEGGSALDLACTDCVALGTETDGEYAKSVAAGLYLDCTPEVAAQGSDYTCGLDTTEMGVALTFGDGASNANWAFDVIGSPNPELAVTVGGFDFGASPVITTGGFDGNAATCTTASGVSCADCVALGSETTGSYAAGDAEAGNATGLACTDCVALGTETTGNYAGSSSEGGPATDVACTDCVALGTETTGNFAVSVAAGLYLDCTPEIEEQGAAYTCGVDTTEIATATFGSGVSNTAWTWDVIGSPDPDLSVTVAGFDFGASPLFSTGGFNGNASTATTASGVVCTDCVTLGTETSGSYVAGATTNGGLEVTGSEGASVGLLTTCADAQILKWDDDTGAWGCADGASGGGDSISVDGVATVDPNFDDGGDINFAYSSPNITATVKADSVALGTDTTGSYVSGRTLMGGLIESGSGDGLTLGFENCDDGQFLIQLTEPDRMWVCATSARGLACTDCVTLGTETTGDYVATVSEGTALDCTGTGEGAAVTCGLDTTEIGTTTWGTAAATWTFEGGAVDPKFTWASDSFAWGGLTNGGCTLVGGTADYGPTLVCGHSSNAVTSTYPYASVIAGGGSAGGPNTISSTYGLSRIGGGYDHALNADSSSGTGTLPGIASSIGGGGHHTIGFRSLLCSGGAEDGQACGTIANPTCTAPGDCVAAGARGSGGTATHGSIQGGSYLTIMPWTDGYGASLLTPVDYSSLGGGTFSRTAASGAGIGSAMYSEVTQRGGYIGGGGGSGQNGNKVTATITQASANSGSYTNPTSAYDNNITTAATASSDVSHVWTFGTGTCTYMQLWVSHDVSTTGSAQTIAYSTNGGVGWTDTATSSTTKITNRQLVGTVSDLTQIQARATCDYTDSGSCRVYEVFYTCAEHGFVGGGKANVASGHVSGVGWGSGNTSSGWGSSAAGVSNQATGEDSTAFGGLNIAAGNYSTAIGYNNNVESGATAGAALGFNNNIDAGDEYAAAPGGRSNSTAGTSAAGQADYSFIEGGYYTVAKDYGGVYHASGRFAAAGDAQTAVFVARKSTTDATPANMALDGASNELNIAVDTTWAFDVVIVARRTDVDGESARYRCYGAIDNDAGATALVGSVVCDTAIEDTAAWDIAVTAVDGATYGTLRIAVTGEAGKTIYWVARVELVEVTG